MWFGAEIFERETQLQSQQAVAKSSTYFLNRSAAIEIFISIMLAKLENANPHLRLFLLKSIICVLKKITQSLKII